MCCKSVATYVSISNGINDLNWICCVSLTSASLVHFSYITVDIIPNRQYFVVFMVRKHVTNTHQRSWDACSKTVILSKAFTKSHGCRLSSCSQMSALIISLGTYYTRRLCLLYEYRKLESSFNILVWSETHVISTQAYCLAKCVYATIHPTSNLSH